MTASTSDAQILTAGGKLLARTWIPHHHSAHRPETILLFHDSLGSIDLWRNFPAALATATGLPVLAYDRLGFGRSDARHDTLPPTFIRDEAINIVPAVLAATGLTRIIPFGHSVGGAMAVATAAHLPDRCAALIIESAQSFVEDRTIAGVRAGQIEFAQPHRFERLAHYHGSKARWVLDAWINTWLAPGYATWTLDDDLQGVTCPTLVLHGDQDEYGSPRHPERIAQNTQGPSQLVILKNCGHVPHREHTARVLQEVNRFLASCNLAT